jgi:hypothetical protein
MVGVPNELLRAEASRVLSLGNAPEGSEDVQPDPNPQVSDLDDDPGWEWI